MSGVWTLYVTDRVGARQAELDVYESAELIGRANDVSTWQIILPTDTAAGAYFVTDPFARLEARLDDIVWTSGPVSNLERTVELNDDSLTITGFDDTIWLARRLAHPQPGTAAPPYATTAYDVHAGQASTVLAELVRVNAGPTAVAARQVPGLVVPVPVAAGGAVTVSARWQNLLQLMQDTARGPGLVFSIVGLSFQVHQPVDHGAVFSQGLGTLAGWKVTATAPKGNKVVVAGQGTGTARTIREYTNPDSINQWGMGELFEDRRDTADVTELDNAGANALAAAIEPTTVVFTPLDSDGQQFGRDWNLGDIVTVIAGELTVVDQVREVHVVLDDVGATITPSVGTPTGDLALFRSLAGLERRVRQLERI